MCAVHDLVTVVDRCRESGGGDERGGGGGAGFLNGLKRLCRSERTWRQVEVCVEKLVGMCAGRSLCGSDQALAALRRMQQLLAKANALSVLY